MAFNLDDFLQQQGLSPQVDTNFPTENSIESPATSSNFDLDNFMKGLNFNLPDPTKAESSLGDTISNSLHNAKLGLMQAVGGDMQALGQAPQSAIQTLSTAPKELPDNPSFSDYLSKYVTYPYNQTLAKARLAATALPALLAPTAMTNLANTGRTIQQEATAQQQENQPNVAPGSLKSKIGAGTDMGAQLLPLLLAGTVAPETIPALFGAQAFGSTYAEQTNAGKTGGEAFLPSLMSGAANTAIGELPLHILTSDSGSLAAKMLKGAIAGEVTAQGLNAVQQAINKNTIDPNMTWDQFKQSASNMEGIGGVLGALGGVGGHILSKGVQEKPIPTPPDSGASFDIPEQSYNSATGKFEDSAKNAPTDNVSTTEPIIATIPAEEKQVETPPSLGEQSPVAEKQSTQEEIPISSPESVLADLEKKYDGLPEQSPDKQAILDKMNDIVENIPTVRNQRDKGLLHPDLETATPEEEETISKYQLAKNQDILPSNNNEIGNNQTLDDIPFSVTEKTDTPEFKKLFGDSNVVDNKQEITSKLDSVIKKINPDVKTKFTDKLFGEGEALKASGAESADRQEVAGSYDKLNNLIHASLNIDKWNPLDTAYHEAYHSVRDMVKPGDDAVLKKTFPGTDKLSQEEHESVEFGRYMTKKNAPGFTPAVKRVFSKIAQALRDIGRTFKLGKFNSVSDIFNRIERGSVYSDYQNSLKSGDIESLKSSTIAPESREQAIKELSPELHKVVYKATEDKDSHSLKQISLENNGTPTERLKAFSNDLFQKSMLGKDVVKDKILRSTVDALSTVTSKDVAEKALADVENSLQKTAHNINQKSGILDSAKNIGRMITTSNDGRIRWMARRFKSPTLVKIADFFHPDPGTGRAVAETYPEEMARVITTARYQVAHVLHSVNKKDLEKVTYYMQHPEEIHQIGTKEGVGRAASVLSRIVQDMRDNLASAGYEVPEVNGFFPRIYDTAKIIANEKDFKTQAKLAYYDTYRDYFLKKPVNDGVAELGDMVDRWYNNLTLQDDGINSNAQDFMNVPSTPPAPSSFKSRTLSKAADDILRDFLHQDPVSAMSSLIYKSARKTAWERRFSADKWKELKADLIKEGVDGQGIRDTVEIIKSNTGQLGLGISPVVKDALALARYFSSLRYLSKVAFIHASYPILTGLRTHSVVNMLRAYHDSIGSLLGTSDAMRNMKLFSELLGLTGDSSEHMLLMNQMGDMPNQKLQYKNERWHDIIGITKLVSSAKLGSIRSLQYFINHLADDIVSHKDSQKSSEFLVRELGVPQDKAGDFADWVKKNQDKQDAILNRNDPHAVIYQTALRRAMDQTIQNPTPATRQLWASHPVGSMIYSLTAYKMAYMKNVLQRAYRLSKESVAQGKGYSMADRLSFAAPAMMLPITVAFAAAYNYAKNQAEGNKYKHNVGMDALDRSEALFPFDGLAHLIATSKLMEPIMGKKYASEEEKKSRFANTLGPNAQLYNDLKDMVFNLSSITGRNGERAAQAEKRKIYDLVLAPAVNSAIGTYTPYPIRPLGFAAVQLINNKQIREKLIK